ncbi:hypothetical protein ES705_48713 [subsurface metagenome]
MNEMVTSDLTYDENFIEDILKDTPKKSYEEFTGSIKSEKNLITIHTDRARIESLQRLIDEYTLFQNKEDEYCIKAIRNLIIKNNFLELYIKLSEDQITEDEYSDKINGNPKKYIIDVEYIQDPNDIKVINEIVEKIGLEFSVDEVAEIFSLDSNDLENNVLKLK